MILSEPRRTNSRIHTLNLFYSAFSNEMRNCINQNCYIWQYLSVYYKSHIFFVWILDIQCEGQTASCYRVCHTVYGLKVKVLE